MSGNRYGCFFIGVVLVPTTLVDERRIGTFAGGVGHDFAADGKEKKDD